MNPNDEKRMDEGTPVANPAAADETAKPSPEDVVKSIRERQDRRDSAGIPTDPEAASACITEQAEDINNLLSAFDSMLAQRDFDSAVDKPTTDSESDPPAGDEGKDPPKTTEEENQDAEGAPAVPAAPAAPAGEGSGTNVELKVTMDSLDQMISERLAVIRVGDKLNLDGLETMPIMQAKAAIVKAVRPGMRMDGMSDDYINAAYDMAAATVRSQKSTDLQRQQMTGGRKTNFDGAPAPTTGGSAADRRAAMITRNQKRKDVE